MTDQPPPIPPAPHSTPGGPGPGYPALTPAGQLGEYFAANRATHTEEALSAAARAAGYAEADIAAGIAQARAREAAGPVQARARTIVTRAYLAVFVVLVAGMGINSGAAVGIGAVILLVTMLVGLGLSRVVIGHASADDSLAIVVALPVIFLIAIAGACVATGLPIGRGTI